MTMRVFKKIRKEIEKKRCKYCKATENLTIDHKVPIIRGGSNEKKNLQVLCIRCNGTKSALSDKDVKRLFGWFLEVQKSRVEHGKKPYTLR